MTTHFLFNQWQVGDADEIPPPLRHVTKLYVRHTTPLTLRLACACKKPRLGCDILASLFCKRMQKRMGNGVKAWNFKKKNKLFEPSIIASRPLVLIRSLM